jgi:hypothetical protein
MSCAHAHVIRKHEKCIYEASETVTSFEEKLISDFARGEIIIKSSFETRHIANNRGA